MASCRDSKGGDPRFKNAISSPSILKKHGTPSSNRVPGRKVRFDLFSIRVMLIEYDKNNESDKVYYNNFICDIRDSANSITDSELIKLLKDARNCINILNENFTLFVKVILVLKWMNRSDEIVKEYQGFLLDVCTAYSYHTTFAIEQLASCFSYVNCEVNDRVNSMPSEEEERGFQNVHETLGALLKVIPLAKDLLMPVLRKKFPYRNSSSESYHHYIHNLLFVIKYEPSLRKSILSLIVNKLVEIDVHISNEELERLKSEVNVEIEDIFPMDIDAECMQTNSNIKNSLPHTLDICIKRVFTFLKITCHNADDNLMWDTTKLLYHDMLNVFENEILPVHNTSHIQYVIYYFLSFKPTLAVNFSNWLWKKCCDVSSPSTLRQAAAGYLASFVCRSPFLSNRFLKHIIFEMSLWCNNYISKVDKSVKIVTEDLLRWHAVFYSMCQALFYIISFQHQNLMDSKKNLMFMENLNLSKIVTCRLSPLRLCCSEVVDRFAYVTKVYQLTYCYAAMDGVIRVTDKSIEDEWLYFFFPFDKYDLPISKNMIIPILQKDINFINSPVEDIHENKMSLSFPETMDISPSMVISPSPGKTDWLGQLICDTNTNICF